ncbi:MAG: VOC family protein [Bacilli bacterium]|nr:VOC family protein [Bacilli bacterium]
MSDFHDKNTPHVSHVTLKVTSLDISKVFYHKVLGLLIQEETDDHVILGNHEESILTLIKVKKHGHFDEGLYHIAFLLPSIKELARWFLYQQKRKFIIHGASDHLVSKAFYFSDPDGNGIEVYADTDPTIWKRTDQGIQMDTLRLDINELIKGETVPDQLTGEVCIGHVHLKSRSTDFMRKFYRLLGMEIQLDMGHAVFLSFQGYHHHLAINQWNHEHMNPYNYDYVGVSGLEFCFPDNDSLDRAIESLKENQYTIMIENQECVVLDPIGIKLTLTAHTVIQ